MGKIAKESLDQIFLNARTHRKWLDKSVPDALLKDIYDAMRLGPTHANCCPLRIVFIRSLEAKERLKPYLDKGNIEKTMTAPVTALFASDLKFHEHLPLLFPFIDLKSYYENHPEEIEEVIFRNGSLQAAYFMIAARAHGLDCGPMSGFSNEGVDKAFFPDGHYKSNFLCNLGYGDPTGLPGPRAPRLDFDQTCKIL